MKMKKISKLFLFISVFSLLIGCNNKKKETNVSTPETALEAFLSNLKKMNTEECSHYLSEDKSSEFLRNIENYFPYVEDYEKILADKILNFSYEIGVNNSNDETTLEDDVIIPLHLEVINYSDFMVNLTLKIFALDPTDYEENEKFAELVDEVINETNKNNFDLEIKMVKKSDTWMIDDASFEELWSKLVYVEGADLVDIYKVDASKVKKENTLLKMGRLEGSTLNYKYFDTPFEFIDYDFSSENYSANDLGNLSFEDGLLTIQIEVAGNIGDAFVIVVTDENFEVMLVVERMLSLNQEVFTIEVIVDKDESDIGFDLYPKDQYDAYGELGDTFGEAYSVNLSLLIEE